MARIVVGVTGASGVILARHGVEMLVAAGHDVDLVLSSAAKHTATYEVEGELIAPHPKVQIHKNLDIGASIASGSYPVDGMIIIPCSMATLAAVSIGLADNLIRRAADVTLKEGRKLVIVPREAPLHATHLENMLKLTKMGASIVPPVPGWYTGHQTLLDVERHICGRALDQLHIGSFHYPRWG